MSERPWLAATTERTWELVATSRPWEAAAAVQPASPAAKYDDAEGVEALYSSLLSSVERPTNGGGALEQGDSASNRASHRCCLSPVVEESGFKKDSPLERRSRSRLREGAARMLDGHEMPKLPPPATTLSATDRPARVYRPPVVRDQSYGYGRGAAAARPVVAAVSTAPLLATRPVNVHRPPPSSERRGYEA